MHKKNDGRCHLDWQRKQVKGSEASCSDKESQAGRQVKNLYKFGSTVELTPHEKYDEENQSCV